MTDPIEQAFAYLDIGHPTVKAALAEIARLRALESRVLAEGKPVYQRMVGLDTQWVDTSKAEYEYTPAHKRRIVFAHPTPDDASEKAAKHWNPVYNTDPVQRACGELPDGFEIEILLEKDAGTVYLVNNNYGERDMMESEDEFEWMIHSAIDAAIDAAMQADKEAK